MRPVADRRLAAWRTVATGEETKIAQNEGFHAANVERDRQKAEEWLKGNFGDRPPYTQVQLDEDVAKPLAAIVLQEEVTIAEAARRFLYRGLQGPDQS